MNYSQLGQQIGSICDTKNEQYGNALTKTGRFLETLYPQGIQPDDYVYVGILVRMFDKMARIANGHTDDGFEDLVGYGLLGTRLAQEEMADVVEPPPLPLTVSPEDIFPIEDDLVYFTYDNDTGKYTKHDIDELTAEEEDV